MTLELDLEEAPTHWRLAVSGELDASGCSQFRMNADRILRYRPESLIVDMSDLEYLDSSGLGILMSLSREHSAAGGHLVLIASAPVNTLLSLVRLNSLFATASTMQEALEVLGLDSTAQPAPDGSRTPVSSERATRM